MIKLSLVIMVVLTVLIAVGLRWREDRVALLRRDAPRPRAGWIALQKRKFNRWVTAAALAAITTMLVLGGVHWLRVWQG